MKAEQVTSESNFKVVRDAIAGHGITAENSDAIVAGSKAESGTVIIPDAIVPGTETEKNTAIISDAKAQTETAINPNFKKEFGDYLEANGYVLSNKPAHPGDALYFFRNGQGVMITGDSIDFASFKEQGSGKTTSCSTYAAFTGISQLDTYGWMMLMHITGIVPLNQFIPGGSDKPARMWSGWPAAAVC